MAKAGNKRRMNLSQEGIEALAKWPPAPKHFCPAEASSWARVGRAAMSARSIATCDLVMAERLAQLHARVDGALANPALKASMLAALLRLEADLLSRMGLSPSGRSTVGQLARRKTKKHNPLSEFVR